MEYNPIVIRETLSRVRPFTAEEAVDLVIFAYEDFCTEVMEMYDGGALTENELLSNLNNRGHDVGLIIEIIRRTNNETSKFKLNSEDPSDGSDDDGHSLESIRTEH